MRRLDQLAVGCSRGIPKRPPRPGWRVEPHSSCSRRKGTLIVGTEFGMNFYSRRRDRFFPAAPSLCAALRPGPPSPCDARPSSSPPDLIAAKIPEHTARGLPSRRHSYSLAPFHPRGLGLVEPSEKGEAPYWHCRQLCQEGLSRSRSLLELVIEIAEGAVARGAEEEHPILGCGGAVEAVPECTRVAHAAIARAEPERLELVFQQFAF